jgi:hypothetical protein
MGCGGSKLGVKDNEPMPQVKDTSSPVKKDDTKIEPSNISELPSSTSKAEIKGPSIVEKSKPLEVSEVHEKPKADNKVEVPHNPNELNGSKPVIIEEIKDPLPVVKEPKPNNDTPPPPDINELKHLTDELNKANLESSKIKEENLEIKEKKEEKEEKKEEKEKIEKIEEKIEKKEEKEEKEPKIENDHNKDNKIDIVDPNLVQTEPKLEHHENKDAKVDSTDPPQHIHIEKIHEPEESNNPPNDLDQSKDFSEKIVEVNHIEHVPDVIPDENPENLENKIED